MLNAWEQMEEVGQSTSEPDPAVLKAIGLNHSIASAFADLVDNSIDAGARRVAIRFVVQQGLVSSLMIVDDGRGMNDDEIDAAMKLGVRRERPDGSLGHFGVGLKAAAFSQASMLRVLSRSQSGPTGRRMPREAGGRAWVVHRLSGMQVGDAMDRLEVDFAIETGTAVVLTDLRTAPRGSDPAVTRAYLENSFQELRSLLGLVFHRLLEAGKVRIQIDEFDADLGAPGVPVEVEPINPFGYRKSGARGYPKPFVAIVSGKRVHMTCHIWTPKSETVQFRLASRVDEQHQGFYLYRADRLLSGGGWKGVVKPSRHRRLARVAVDIDLHLDLFQMSMEKSGVVMAQELVLACEQATATDGTTFDEYLSAAESVMRSANKKRARLKEMLPPGKGLHPCVERAVTKHVGFLPGEEPLEIRWTRFATDDFVEVDRQERVLKLNRRYRHYLLGDRRASLNDVPVLKALLYLVFEDIFRKSAYGPLDKMKVALWSEVLNAVAKQEERSHE